MYTGFNVLHRILMRSRAKIKIICSVFLAAALPCIALRGQTLVVIKKNKTYWQQVQADSSLKMIGLKSACPSIRYDLRYATPENFTGQKLYKSGRETFLRNPVASALCAVQETLQQKGLGLKVFDAYRPYSATQKMWELIHDDRYVADPAKGSGHNRGLSVDLTLVNLQTGKELDMGTGFDNFTDSAHHDFKNLSPAVLQNRLLLKEAMEQKGFKALSTEWWHYSWPNDGRYDVLDLDFKKLRR